MDEPADAPRREVPPGLQRQLDQGYAFGSVLTFGQRPLLTDPEQLDEWRPDVAVVGAPFDLGTTNRPGARFGPRALRTRAYQSGTYHLGLGLEIYDWVEVVDYGDAHCPNGLVDESLANIRERVHEVARRGIVPFVMGGDHTVGLRSLWPPEEVWDWMAEQGMRWHLMDEIWERGFHAVMADAVDEALEGADHLYISIDIDSLDPSYAPATGTPEPGGIVAADLLRIVRQLARRHHVVGMDIVEVAPDYDHADCTVNVAHRLFTECLAGMGAKRRDAAGGGPGRPGT